MFDGAHHTLIPDVDQGRQMFGLHERSLTYQKSQRTQTPHTNILGGATINQLYNTSIALE